VLRQGADGEMLDAATWNARKGEWLPTEADEAYIKSSPAPLARAGPAAWVEMTGRGAEARGRPARAEAAIKSSAPPGRVVPCAASSSSTPPRTSARQLGGLLRRG